MYRYRNIYILDARRGALKRPPSRATFRRSDAPSLRRCDTQASTPQSSRLLWFRCTVVPSHVVPSLRGSVVPLGTAGLSSTKETPLSETELRESLSLLISSKTQDPELKTPDTKLKPKTPELKPTTAELKPERPELKPKTPELKPKSQELKSKTAT